MIFKHSELSNINELSDFESIINRYKFSTKLVNIIKFIFSICYSFILGYLLYSHLNLVYSQELLITIIFLCISTPLLFLIVAIVHELIHYVFLPKDTRLIEFSFKKCFISCSFDNSIAKNQLYLMLFSPTFLLTLIPLVVILIYGFNIITLFIFFINSIYSVDDIVNMIFVAKLLDNYEHIKLFNSIIYLK